MKKSILYTLIGAVGLGLTQAASAVVVYNDVKPTVISTKPLFMSVQTPTGPLGTINSGLLGGPNLRYPGTPMYCSHFVPKGKPLYVYAKHGAGLTLISTCYGLGGVVKSSDGTVFGTVANPVKLSTLLNQGGAPFFGGSVHCTSTGLLPR